MPVLPLSLHGFFKPAKVGDVVKPSTVQQSADQLHMNPQEEAGPSAQLRTMLNSGSTCYVNATLQSLAVAIGSTGSAAELNSLLQTCLSHPQEPRPLNPVGLFALRSLMPRWNFDGWRALVRGVWFFGSCRLVVSS